MDKKKEYPKITLEDIREFQEEYQKKLSKEKGRRDFTIFVYCNTKEAADDFKKELNDLLQEAGEKYINKKYKKHGRKNEI